MENWHSYLYLYIVGGLIFLTPILLALKKKSINPKVKADRKLLFALFGAYFFYLILQGLWNYWAIHS